MRQLARNINLLRSDPCLVARQPLDIGLERGRFKWLVAVAVAVDVDVARPRPRPREDEDTKHRLLGEADHRLHTALARLCGERSRLTGEAVHVHRFAAVLLVPPPRPRL